MSGVGGPQAGSGSALGEPPARAEGTAIVTDNDRISRLSDTIHRAVAHLRSRQHADGHWCAELEGDTILESEYALLLYFLGRGADPRFGQLANYLRSQQLAEGGWPNFPSGPSVVSVSTKAYLVLKLAGDDPEAPHMRAAASSIRAQGGLAACNSYTKILLAIFGLFPWRKAPAIPPELVLLPRWFYFNIYQMSAWSRAIVVPLSIVWAHRPFRPVPQSSRLDELDAGSPLPQPLTLRRRLWAVFFRAVDWLIHTVERSGFLPMRRRALERATRWMEERFEGSDGLGAIFPPMMNSVMALVCVGRELGDPLLEDQLSELRELEILEGDELRVQPCFSPVWDTALAVGALRAAGVAEDDAALRRAAEWLLDREVTRGGDWCRSNPGAEPGGWYFEYANEFYPDCDDTAEVLTALVGLDMGREEAGERLHDAIGRGLRWQLSMQSDNGGWGAFDRNCNRTVLEYVPFADHNAMLDPPTVDITARTIVALKELDLDSRDPRIQRAVAFLRREQEKDGAWYGRWGANYIYGTWLALSACAAVGLGPTDPMVRRGVNWLLAVQRDDGGWGESLASYQEPSLRGRGETTFAQTAWAVTALLASGAHDEPEGRQAIRRGTEVLLAGQRPDGGWVDEHWTGTGFPQVFYLRYHLYATYFPLEALARYEKVLAAAHVSASTDVSGRDPYAGARRTAARARTAASA